MSKKLKINFVLPIGNLSGGPLAILEYAQALLERGHDVTVTSLNSYKKPPKKIDWFDFGGKVIFRKTRLAQKVIRRILHHSRLLKIPGAGMIFENLIQPLFVMRDMPDCDINVATLWSSAIPVLLSKKGKPVYFMQHYEEVFFNNDNLDSVIGKLLCRMTYQLPIYKIANSSWLQNQIQDKCNQKVPFSNNSIHLSDFNLQKKKSENDGVLRVVTYINPAVWKGFADVAQAMSLVKKKYGDKVQWHTFGYLHPGIPPENDQAPYQHHAKISFKELSALYASSDIAICASWYESFPLPPLEAMASGTATVTTFYGMEDYAVDGENCLIAKPRDIESLTESIEKLIENQDLRQKLAANGRKTAETYSWKKAADVREKMLLDIHNNKVEYDLYAPLDMGLKDENQISFEKIANDIDLKDGELISNNSEIYLVENSTIRHLSSQAQEGIVDKKSIREIDSITFSRILKGFNIEK